MGAINPGDYVPPGDEVYFNRTDVQAAINAPIGTNWQQCTDVNVFADKPTRVDYGPSDQSLGPAQDGVLQRVIEYTNNTIIGQGNLDMLLSTNGTLLAIQNMTWNGVQGFQSFPGTPFYVPYHPEYNGGSLAGAGNLGSWGTERGLTFYQVQLSGHELPGYAPGAAYRVLEMLLGRVDSLSDVSGFTTESGNFTGTSPILASKEKIIGGRRWPQRGSLSSA
jgi:carboxypeptidase D